MMQLFTSFLVYTLSIFAFSRNVLFIRGVEPIEFCGSSSGSGSGQNDVAPDGSGSGSGFGNLIFQLG